MRLWSILGQLIRHATVIQNDLAESEIWIILWETCNNKTDGVKRRAIAGLGEYLFYAATQLDEENADPVWTIPPEAVETVFHQLSLDTDEVTKYYATKTIENISAQSLSGGILFATLDIATALLGIYNSTQNEGLKISAAVSISHIWKLHPSIFPTIFESISCHSFWTILWEGLARIQQAFITMLNIALTNPYPKLNDVLMEEPKFKEAMSNLIENSNIVIKGKWILTILLLFKMDPHWIILVDEFKFYSICDRMSRDYSKYIQYCLLCLIDGVLELIPKILGIIKKDFTKYIKDQSSFNVLEDTVINRVMKEATKKIKTNKSEHLPEGMVLIISIYDLLKSQLFKNKIICKDLIVLIGLILEKTEGMESDTVNEIRNYNLLILENLCTNQKAIIVHNKAIVDHVLPCLITRIQSSDSETKFSCLKSFTDLITQYLGDDKIYDADGTQETTKKINEMILKRLFPHYGSILSDDDPLPLFGLKLLCAIVERNSAFVTILKKLKLVDIMMEYFTVGHQRFNTHLIKIVWWIVESKELKLEELQEYDLVNKLNKVLTNTIEGDGESCLDHLLDIVYELLHYIAETIKDSVSSSLILILGN